MPLERGEVQSYSFDRMVVEFTLLNQGKVILCAIGHYVQEGLSGCSLASAVSCEIAAAVSAFGKVKNSTR